jgi:hypothetical protein
MVDYLAKCFLVLKRQIELRFGKDDCVELFLDVVGHLPNDRFKLCAGEISVGVGNVDPLFAFSAQLKGLGNAVIQGPRVKDICI